jgi:hypothetical protein
MFQLGNKVDSFGSIPVGPPSLTGGLFRSLTLVTPHDQTKES